MSHAVELPDDLIADARAASAAAARSVSDQIEHWARLGRRVDACCTRSSANPESERKLEALSRCIETVNTPEGRQRLAAYLETLPFPHFEPVPGRPGYFVRIESDGRRTTGRFVGRAFEAAD